MAAIKFAVTDVVRLLGLPNAEAVEGLIASNALQVSAYTRRGRPLFDADSIQRAAERVVQAAE